MLPSRRGGGACPARVSEEPGFDVTAAQRLRLVLALGVINLVLASVALGVGIAGAPFATPGIAVVEPTPAAPNGSTPGGPPGTSNPGSPRSPQPSSRPGGTGPEPSTEPGSQPTPTPTPPEASPSPSIEPAASPVPSEPPAPTPTTPRQVLAVKPGTSPASSSGGGGGPQSTPRPPANPTPAPTPASTPVVRPQPKPTTCHASARGVEASKGKACGTKRSKPPHDRGEGRGRSKHATHQATYRESHHAQPATLEPKRRNPVSKHRLRPGRRAR